MYTTKITIEVQTKTPLTPAELGFDGCKIVDFQIESKTPRVKFMKRIHRKREILFKIAQNETSELPVAISFDLLVTKLEIEFQLLPGADEIGRLWEIVGNSWWRDGMSFADKVAYAKLHEIVIQFT